MGSDLRIIVDDKRLDSGLIEDASGVGAIRAEKMGRKLIFRKLRVLGIPAAKTGVDNVMRLPQVHVYVLALANLNQDHTEVIYLSLI
jgi:hypothetical protein